MLILSRRAGEVVRIGDDIKVSVLSVNGTQVRIGVQAPGDIPVHREEIYQRIQAEISTGGTETNGVPGT